MITDYASLQSAIADYLGRSDLTSQIQTFINQGEARIYRKLRVIDMEKSLSLTMSGSTNGIPSAAVPSDYIEMREIYLLDQNGIPYQPIERCSPFWLHSQFNALNVQGTTAYFAREGQNFIFAPWQSVNNTAGGIYYARLPSLSGTNTTNWLTTKNQDLIFAAAMLEAGTYLADDEAVAYWESRFQAITQDVQVADEHERGSGSPPVMRPA